VRPRTTAASSSWVERRAEMVASAVEVMRSPTAPTPLLFPGRCLSGLRMWVKTFALPAILTHVRRVARMPGRHDAPGLQGTVGRRGDEGTGEGG
jgi:hypothetical protein